MPATVGRGGIREDWTNFTGYFARVRSQGISMNLITHVSYHQVRRVVKGFDESPATPAELERMKQLTARSMEEGAWGLVTIPVHLFHFKVRARGNWGTIGRFIAQVDEARSRGLDVTANQYPYTAMFHGWSSFFPLWVREGGPDQFAARLRDLSLRERIKSDPDFIEWAEEHGWWEGIVLAQASRPEVRRYEGMTVAEIASSLGVPDPADVAIDLMAQEGGGISGIFHAMSEADVRLAMRQPWMAHASDGSAINLDAPGVPHPRNYATVPRVLGHYVRDEGVLTLEDAVRKMTSLPAQILGLQDRGQIREDFVADIAIFDPDRVAETNSFENPKSYAAGIPYVIVNGTLVIDEGEHTGARPGTVTFGRGYKPGTPVSDGSQ